MVLVHSRQRDINLGFHVIGILNIPSKAAQKKTTTTEQLWI